MKKFKLIWSYYRIISALAILTTQIILWGDSWSVSSFEPINFFGYWTNQGNILGAIALLIASKYTGKNRNIWIEIVRFVATVDLIMVTVLYWCFVQGDDVGGRFVWANYMVHLVTGVLVIIDWIIEGPKKTISFSHIWIAIIYPVIWLIITGVRFTIDSWVPYSVLEPSNGVAQISSIVITFLLSSIFFGLIVLLLARLRRLTPSSLFET